MEELQKELPSGWQRRLRDRLIYLAKEGRVWSDSSYMRFGLVQKVARSLTRDRQAPILKKKLLALQETYDKVLKEHESLQRKYAEEILSTRSLVASGGTPSHVEEIELESYDHQEDAELNVCLSPELPELLQEGSVVIAEHEHSRDAGQDYRDSLRQAESRCDSLSEDLSRMKQDYDMLSDEKRRLDQTLSEEQQTRRTLEEWKGMAIAHLTRCSGSFGNISDDLQSHIR